MQDGYTVTGRYPYSTPAVNGQLHPQLGEGDRRRLSRHGALLPDRRRRSCRADIPQRVPALFVPLADMPEDMRSRLRYPEGIFSMQAAVYATYHMTNPSVFYNKEDLWEVPAIDGEARPQPMQPYYTVMRLPGERQAEFIQMLPFTPARKDNLASWMVARSDGEHYGRMMVFQFPKQKVVFGPRQVVARINQDQVISPQITLEPAGFGGPPGHAARHPDRGVADSTSARSTCVRPAAASRAEARHRRVPESDRDGGDAGRRAQPAVPERRRAADAGTHATLRRITAGCLYWRRRAATNCLPARWITTAALSSRSERATGQHAATRSSGSARCWRRRASRK